MSTSQLSLLLMMVSKFCPNGIDSIKFPTRNSNKFGHIILLNKSLLLSEKLNISVRFNFEKMFYATGVTKNETASKF